MTVGEQPQPQPAVAPFRGGAADTKTIYLIRHGEGFHNIGYDHNLDAHLTPRGWAQAGALQQHLRGHGIELVVVSPLRRTLETAAGVTGMRAPPPAAMAAAAASGSAAGSSAATSAAAAPSPAAAAAAATAAQSSPWLLMLPQAARPCEVTQQAALYLPAVVSRRSLVAAAGAAGAAGAGAMQGAVLGGAGAEDTVPLKLLAHAGCRERIGPNVCDKHRDIPLQAAAFPGVDFSLVTSPQDDAWEALHLAPQVTGCYNLGESEADCEARALQFYAWLMSRPESTIAVVSHCGFLVHGMRVLGRTMFGAWSDAVMVHCGGGRGSAASTPAAAGPANGPAPLPGAVGSSAAAAAAADGAGGAAAAAGVGPEGGMDVAAAEALRLAAGDIAGRMSADWMNCECRTIQLRWASTAELAPATAAAAGANNGGNGNGGGNGSNDAHGSGISGVAAAAVPGSRFLCATPGDSLTWWPGGFMGLN